MSGERHLSVGLQVDSGEASLRGPLSDPPLLILSPHCCLELLLLFLVRGREEGGGRKGGREEGGRKGGGREGGREQGMITPPQALA